jgi:protein-S-isoprenylcysteine O-methyltransferase Ste14
MYLLAGNIIRVCWALFFIVWIAASISTKRAIYRESSARRARYSLLLVAAYFLLLNPNGLPHPFDRRLFPCTDTVAWVCAMSCLAGLIFCVWARATLGRNWSGRVTLKENHELIERGPYRIVRHPIYTGLLVMYLATAILLGRMGALIFGVPLVFASFWIKLRDEEEIMLKQFPDQYAAYQQRTARIIPFLL